MTDSKNDRSDDIFFSLSSTDLTALAREGAFDAVTGRDNEIRRIINILTRRSKNNALLVGDAGVGKTAVVEGLAMLIARGDVPSSLKHKRIISLDVTNLVAGTSMRGQFEEKLKRLIDAVTNDDEIILFIDEIHLIVGAGAAGEASLDIANVLKPHLARGKMQCIGATTFGEYARYIEKDGALARRFQKIVIGEPSVEDAIAILRGLRQKFEAYHGIDVRDSALVAAVQLSHRYISERKLPDKAIDLIDETASRRRMEIDSPPGNLRDLEERIAKLELERASLAKDKDQASTKRLLSVETEIKHLTTVCSELRAAWLESLESISRGQATREKIEKLKLEIEQAKRDIDFRRAAELEHEQLVPLQKKLDEEDVALAKVNAANRAAAGMEGTPVFFNHPEKAISVADVERQISEWTEIPIERLSESEATRLLNLEDQLQKRVIGQDAAIKSIADAVRIARAGINDPQRPIASFLFLGPSGVGKTEVTKVLAATIFGDTSAFIRLDMSEFFDRYTVSRLIGASPGYVGYEEGGQLTEAVRRKPFSCVLFDEIEKAHSDVYDILLQVLDEGRLTDARGRVIDFKNTIIVMTSNIGSELLSGESKKGDHGSKNDEEDHHVRTAAGQSPQKSDTECGGIDSLPPQLSKMLLRTFRPELLNRIDEIVVFKQLSEDKLLPIIDLHIEALNERLKSSGRTIQLTEKAKDWLASLGYSPAYGARPLRRLIRRFVEVPLSQHVLANGDAKNLLVDLEGEDNLSFTAIEGKERSAKKVDKAKVIDKEIDGVDKQRRRVTLTDND